MKTCTAITALFGLVLLNVTNVYAQTTTGKPPVPMIYKNEEVRPAPPGDTVFAECRKEDFYIIELGKNATYDDVIQILASCASKGYFIKDPIKATWPGGKVFVKDYRETLNLILPPTHTFAETSDNIVVTLKSELKVQPMNPEPVEPGKPAVATTESSAYTNAYIDAGRGMVPPQALMKRYPQAYNPDGTIGDFGQLNAMSHELSAAQAAYHWQPRVYSTGYYGSNVYGSGVMVDASITDYLTARRTRGSLKATGDTKGVEFYVDGCYIGDANQLDSWWDQKSAQLAGRMVEVTVRRVKDGMSYSRPVRFTAKADGSPVDEDHLTFGVHIDNFRPDNGGKKFDFKAAELRCAQSR